MHSCWLADTSLWRKIYVSKVVNNFADLNDFKMHSEIVNGGICETPSVSVTVTNWML